MMDELGVNLAGVEVILRMAERINELQQQVEKTTSTVEGAKGGRKMRQEKFTEQAQEALAASQELVRQLPSDSMGCRAHSPGTIDAAKGAGR